MPAPPKTPAPKKKPKTPSVRATMTGIADLPEPRLAASPTPTYYAPERVTPDQPVTGEMRGRASQFLRGILNPNNTPYAGRTLPQGRDQGPWWSLDDMGKALTQPRNVNLAYVNDLLSRQYPEAAARSSSVQQSADMPGDYRGQRVIAGPEEGRIDIKPGLGFDETMTTMRHELSHGMGLHDRLMDIRIAEDRGEPTPSRAGLKPDTTDVGRASDILHRDIALPRERGR